MTTAYGMLRGDRCFDLFRGSRRSRRSRCESTRTAGATTLSVSSHYFASAVRASARLWRCATPDVFERCTSLFMRGQRTAATRKHRQDQVKSCTAGNRSSSGKHHLQVRESGTKQVPPTTKREGTIGSCVSPCSVAILTYGGSKASLCTTRLLTIFWIDSAVATISDKLLLLR